MVIKLSPIFLVIGQDNPSKEKLLTEIKGNFLPANLETFNLDVLFGHDLTLRMLQEKLLGLPVKSKNRIVVIKQAQSLKEEIKKFLLGYAKKPHDSLVIILDFNSSGWRDTFVSGMSKFSRVYRFQEEVSQDAFMLWRQINSKKPAAALRILKGLLSTGEKPERILGGLRYSCLRDAQNRQELRKKLKALIECDLNIKTGKIKPDFALEKLIIGLCGFIGS